MNVIWGVMTVMRMPAVLTPLVASLALATMDIVVMEKHAVSDSNVHTSFWSSLYTPTI